MRDFTLEDYKALKERLTQENGREPEQLELALACYEMGYSRAETREERRV